MRTRRLLFDSNPPRFPYFVALLGILGLAFIARTNDAVPDWVNDAMHVADTVQVDSRADYVTLSEHVSLKYSEDIIAERRVRNVTKILSAEVSDFSNLHIPLGEGERVKSFRLWQRVPGKQFKEFSDRLIKYSSLTESSYKEYSDFVVGTVEIGAQYIGTILAYEYEVVDSGRLGAFNDEETINNHAPILDYCLEIEYPQNWDIKVTKYLAEHLIEAREDNKITFRGKNLPRIPEEPYTPPWSYLETTLSISCTDTTEYDPVNSGLYHVGHFSNWRNVSAWLVRLTDSLTIPSKRSHEIVDSIRMESESEFDLQRRLAEFAQEEIEYVAIELGDGRFVPRRDTVTLKYKIGDCKDKTTLARSLFAAAGYETAMALVRIGDDLNPYIANPFVFNHAVMAIRRPPDSIGVQTVADSVVTFMHADRSDSIQFRIAHDWTFFDPTDEDAVYGKIPENLKGHLTLIGDTSISQLLFIPDSKEPAYRSRTTAEAQLDSSGSMTSQVKMTTTGYRAKAEKSLSGMLTNRMFQQSLESALKGISPGANVTLKNRDCDDDSCFREFTVDVPSFSHQVENELYFRPNFTYPREGRLMTSETRSNPIWFGPSFTSTLEVIWSIDSALCQFEDPQSIDFSSDFGEVKSSIEWIDSHSLRFTHHIMSRGRIIPVSDYALAREFEKNIVAVTQQMIGLKKVLEK